MKAKRKKKISNRTSEVFSKEINALSQKDGISYTYEIEEPSYDYNCQNEISYDFDNSVKPHKHSVKDLKKNAATHTAKLKKEGFTLNPITTKNRQLAKTFWGKAWCKNLERYKDLEYRLPRGRSYLHNGCVIDLQIEVGKIVALVSGGNLYEVEVKLDTLKPQTWRYIIEHCSNNIGSLLELLSGELSHATMTILTDEHNGLFPNHHEIKMSCNCLDIAGMCKHIAAVLYGVGIRLDTEPELFFKLRDINQNDLISHSNKSFIKELDTNEIEFNACELATLFGIDISLE
ncbi:MAG: hypothetical protein R3B45_16630 [Bdellovibrionota bacterium]